MNTCGLLRYIAFLMNNTDMTEEELVQMEKAMHSLYSVSVEGLDCTSDTLIITNQEIVYEKYRREGFAVLAYLPRGKAWKQSPLYITEEFSEDMWSFCNLVFCRMNGLPLVVLKTERCYLREITQEDLPRLYEIYEDPSITQYMENLYADPEQERIYTRQYIQNIYGLYGYGMWVIVDTQKNRVIGRAGIEYKEAPKEAEGLFREGLELGYVIDVKEQGRGIATEVCHAVLQYAKEEIPGLPVFAMTKSENTASVRLLQKLGFFKVAEGGKYECYLQKTIS